eukprot:2161301-Pyramimonas_sp.AAC.1
MSSPGPIGTDAGPSTTFVHSAKLSAIDRGARASGAAVGPGPMDRPSARQAHLMMSCGSSGTPFCRVLTTRSQAGATKLALEPFASSGTTAPLR